MSRVAGAVLDQHDDDDQSFPGWFGANVSPLDLSKRFAEDDGSGWPTLRDLAKRLLYTLRIDGRGGEEPDAETHRRVGDLAGELQVAIDRAIGEQLALVMSHPRFRRLEATWRGIAHVADVQHAFQTPVCEVHVADYGPDDLREDLDPGQQSWRRSWLYRTLYERALDTAGGKPIGLVVTGMAFGGGGMDAFEELELLGIAARIAEASLCPIVVGASPRLLAREDFSVVPEPDLLELNFDDSDPLKGPEDANTDAALPKLPSRSGKARRSEWDALRRSSESRFLGLVAPRIVLRQPLSRLPGCGDWFGWALVHSRETTARCHRPLLGAATFALAANVVRSMKAGWPSDIQGVRAWGDGEPMSVSEAGDGRAPLMENSGGVSLLPGESFTSDPDWVVARAPLEVTLTGAQERWLWQCGIMTISRVPHTARAAFYALRMLREPRSSRRAQDNATEELHSLLPHILTAARFAQWLKLYGREHGIVQTAGDLQSELQDMLGRYKGASMPLSEATVTVREDGLGGFACSLSISPRLSAEDVEVVGAIPLEIQVVNPPMPGMENADPTSAA